MPHEILKIKKKKNQNLTKLIGEKKNDNERDKLEKKKNLYIVVKSSSPFYSIMQCQRLKWH